MLVFMFEKYDELLFLHLVDMINSDENVTLNEHVLNNLQGAQLSLNDDDVQIFQTQSS
jgi:hypothetical protein